MVDDLRAIIVDHRRASRRQATLLQVDPNSSTYSFLCAPRMYTGQD